MKHPITARKIDGGVVWTCLICTRKVTAYDDGRYVVHDQGDPQAGHSGGLLKDAEVEMEQ